MSETALQTIPAGGQVATTAAAPQARTSAQPKDVEPKNFAEQVFTGVKGLPPQRKLMLMILIPILLGGIISALMWSSKEQYKVLFSGLSDQDGGQIVEVLKQMNVPYEYSANGGSILIPESAVYDTRLALATQGLPKGSTVGLEIFEKQKLGVTQFQEHVNYQRGLEGELARSISALATVSSARVHLAIPKSTVFLRDSQRPTASVVVNLVGSRRLNESQIAGIIHLIASSVPDMDPADVSIVDQNGKLLTEASNGTDGADMADQMAKVQSIENTYQKRIMDILVPIYGMDNVQASVTAKVDFAAVEQSAEAYKPNAAPDQATIRSQQLSEERNGVSDNPSGVPGVASNAPVGSVTAPIGQVQSEGVGANSPANQQARKDSVINYEVDKTVTLTRKNVVDVVGLTATVALNYKTITNNKGQTRQVPYTSEELKEVESMVANAIGINVERGDKITVAGKEFVNNSFDVQESAPAWESILKQSGLPLAIALVALGLIFGVIRPLFKREGTVEVIRDYDVDADPLMNRQEVGDDELIKIVQPSKRQPILVNAQDSKQIEEAKKRAVQNPEMSANIIKSWIGE